MSAGERSSRFPLAHRAASPSLERPLTAARRERAAERTDRLRIEAAGAAGPCRKKTLPRIGAAAKASSNHKKFVMTAHTRRRESCVVRQIHPNERTVL